MANRRTLSQTTVGVVCFKRVSSRANTEVNQVKRLGCKF